MALFTEKTIDVSVEDVPNVIATCCVLHNICEMHGDTFDESLLEGVETGHGTLATTTTASGVSHSMSEVNVRQALMAFFPNHLRLHHQCGLAMFAVARVDTLMRIPSQLN